MGQPLIADENGVRWITLDRPEIRNALYAEDLARIRHAVTGIGDSVKAVVLTGNGSAPSRPGCIWTRSQAPRPRTAGR